MFKTASLTDKGLKRDNNEDAYLVMEDSNLFLVSDGMGGHEKGEVASKIIVDTFSEVFSHEIFNNEDEDETVPCETEDSDATLEDTEEKYKKLNIKYILNNIVNKSTSKIVDYAIEHGIDVKMGATLVGMYKLQDIEQIAVFHLGDSRIYRVRDYHIERLTVDHSKYEEMKKTGRYSVEELNKVSRSSITKAVGNFSAKALTIDFVTLEKDDIFLLCSDGVSDLCADEELLNHVLQEKNNLEKCCQNIKKLIYDRGAKDNLTIVLVEY